MVAAILWRTYQPAVQQVAQPHIPTLFTADLPTACQQVVLVLTPNDHSPNARLWRLERDPGQPWHTITTPIDITWGHQGLAWGTGEHTANPPPGFRIKHEGDKCSPAGIFRIPFAFGIAPASDATWLKLPYTPLTPDIIGVDDPKSAYYNQVVSKLQVPTPDWDSDEPMSRHTVLYQWGAFIANNPQHVPGLGSCIFFHLWPGPGLGTSGCTAMSAENLKVLLAWLDPKKEPRLVQGMEGW